MKKALQKTVQKTVVYTARLGVTLVGLVSLVGLILVLVTQVGPFRRWALQKGVNALNNLLEADISIGDVSGDFLTGLTIYDVRMTTGDTLFAEVPRIELQYTLPPIFDQSRITARAVLHRPNINLVRDEKGVWNFQKIVAPAVDTLKAVEPDKPFAWTLDFPNVELREGTVRIHDYSTTSIIDTTRHVIDYTHTRLTDLNAQLGLFFAEGEQSLSIKDIRFGIPSSGFHLRGFSGDLRIDDDGMRASNVRLRTDSTTLTVNARMDSVNVFDTAFGSKWIHAPFALDIEAPNVSTDELYKIVPALDFLGGTPSLMLSVSGRYDSINVDELVLKTGESQIEVTGTVENMGDPQKLFIDAAIADSRVRWADVEAAVPGLDLPDLSYLGTVDMEAVTYSGKQGSFTSVLDVKTAIGEAKGGVWLDYSGKRLAYRTDMAVIGLDLEPLVKDPLWAGEVNGRIVAEGSGTSLDELQARARVKVNSSNIYGRPVRRLYADASFGERGMITVDTILIAWGDKDGSEPISIPSLNGLGPGLQRNFSVGGRLDLDGVDAQVFAESPSLEASGWYDMRNPDVPRYRLSAAADRFDLSEVTLDPQHKTRLDLVIEAEGQGLQPDDLDGVVRVRATDVMLPDGQVVPPFTATATIDRQDNENRALSLESDALDLRLEGRWSFSTMGQTLTEGFEKLADYIARKRSYSESNFFPLGDGSYAPINATYEVVPKDLTVIEAFLPGTDLEMSASLRGEISGTTQLLGITSRGLIDRLRYRSGDVNLEVDSTEIDIDIRNITRGAFGDLLDAEITVTTDTLIRYNDMSIALPEFRLAMQDGVAQIHAATTINGELSLAVDGALDVSAPEGYLLTLDTLIFGVRHDLNWRNEQPVNIVLAENDITINSFVMRRVGGELMSITGSFIDYERFRDVQVNVSDAGLDQLSPFIQDPAMLDAFGTIGGSVDTLNVTLNGTLDNPEIQAVIALDSTYYADMPVGDLRATLDYRNRNLTGDILLYGYVDTSATQAITARIDIQRLPVNLAFASVEERFIAGQPLRVDVNTDKLPLAVAAPFVPGVAIRGGTTTLNFTIDGAYPNLSYTGKGKIEEGRVVPEATNVPYTVNAEFGFENELLDVTVAIRNLPSDYRDGRAVARGKIAFDGFVPEQFNVSLQSSGLLVLSEASQAVNEVMYGDLVVGTGDPISVTGTPDNIKVRGDVRVLSGDLRLPIEPTASTSAQPVNYVDYKEWRARIENQYGPILNPGMADSLGLPSPAVDRGDSAERTRGEGLEGTFERMIKGGSSLGDSMEGVRRQPTGATNLDVDLEVTIPDEITVTIEIGLLQQLVLRIANEGEPVYFRMVNGEPRLYGRFELQEGSRLVYYKSFEASGYVLFDGPIENPEFNISAVFNGRRYVNTTSQEYSVTVTLAGRRERPDLTFTYWIENGPLPSGDREEDQYNAIRLLLTGRTADETVTGQQVFEESLQQVGSSAVTTIFGGALNNTGPIQTIDIELGNQLTDLSQARVNVVFQAASKVLVRYNGRVSTLEDGTISIELPLDVIADIPLLENIVAQIQREVVDQEGAGGGSLSTTESAIYRLRLQFRKTW